MDSSTSNPKKRLMLDSDSDSENEYWPRFIVLSSTDDSAPLSNLSPFAILKGINGIAGAVRDIKKLRSGQILIECGKKAHADNLLRATMLANVGMKASPHRSLNSSKGVIRTSDLRNVDEAEIADELKPQGVTHVRRICIKKEGKLTPTNTYILSFSRPTPPKLLKVGYLNVRVDLYIPNPLRCFRCQKYGHGKDACTNDVSCLRCGHKGHDNSNCQNPAKCSNCQEAHMAISKDCPVWKKEKLIQKIKAERNISYPEARRAAEALAPPMLSQSYARVAKPSMRTIECQTDCTWITGDKPARFTPEVKVNTATRPMTAQRTQTEALPRQVAQKLRASGQAPKKTTPKDRLPKAEKASISVKNKYQNLADIEMEEAEDHHDRDRSRSPKNSNGRRSPVHPPT